MTHADIESREDVERLVDGFYTRVRADDLLAPIFGDVARVNWSLHLPKMYDFWDAVLFGRPGFKGNPLMVHRTLALQVPLTSAAFERWLSLFHTTVDELFAGPVAEEAKSRAVRIAMIMSRHIEADRAAHGVRPHATA